MNISQAATYLPPYLNKVQKRYAFGSGSNPKLIQVIANLLPLAVEQTAQLAPHFKGGTPQDTARNIYNFLRTQLQYAAEPWHSQNPKAPSALIGSGVGDCKSFALFAYGIAYNLGLNPVLRFTSDVSTTEATHVYTTTKGGVIDGTISQFNYEVPKPKFLKDIEHKPNMEINSITGHRHPQPVGSWVGDAFRWVGDKIVDIVPDNVERIGKVATLVIPRQAYLLLVSLNVKSLATKLNGNRDAVLNKWYDFGGEKSALAAAIADGVRKAPFLGIAGTAFITYPQRNGIGEVATATTIAAAVATATPIIVAMAPLIAAGMAILNEVGVFDKKVDSQFGAEVFTQGDGGGYIVESGGQSSNYSPNTYTTGGGGYTTQGGGGTTTQPRTIFGLPAIAVYAGGALLAFKLLKK